MRHVEVFLLAVVAAAVAAGVAAAVAGHGSLREDVPDSPARGLPDGPLSPADLDAVRFPLALRGYRMAEVDAVLDRLRDELARAREGPPGAGGSGPGGAVPHPGARQD